MGEIRDLQRSIGPRLVCCPTAMLPVSVRGLSSPQQGTEVNCRTLGDPPTYRTLLRIRKSALRNTLFSLALLCSLTMCCCSTLAQKRQQDRPVPIEPAAGEREARKLIE